MLLAGLTLAIVAGVGSVSAADPSPAPSYDTLGARVGGYVIVDESNDLSVINLGTVTTTFEAEAPGGWTIAPHNLTLAPQQEGHFTVGGRGDAGTIAVLGYATDGLVGTENTAIRFGAITVMQSRPADYTQAITTALWVVLLLAGIAFLMWRIKPWRLRLVRAA